MKKIGLWIGFMLVLIPVLVACGEIAQPDYTAVPELGQQIDLVEGLSEEEREAAIRNYLNSDRSAYEELRIIAANCHTNIPEEYFGGCYFADVMTDPKLYVLLTDLSVSPVIKNDRVKFFEVKYAKKELLKYQSLVWEYYLEKGIREAGVAVEKNKVEFGFKEGTDISALYQLVPEDAVEYYFLGEGDGFELLVETEEIGQ